MARYDFVPRNAYPLNSWYSEEKLAKVVDLCMKAISDIGLSGDMAVVVPQCLEMAIARSNNYALAGMEFKPKFVDWNNLDRDEFGEITNDESLDILLRRHS